MAAKPIVQGTEFPKVTSTSSNAENTALPAEFERDRIKVLQNQGDNRAASFQFDGEDHTLGNALRYIIMKNPDVEFCGYSIPHPSEAKMNLRIQIYEDVENVSVFDVLDKGLQDLMDMCDVIEEKFVGARDQFREDRMQA